MKKFFATLMLCVITLTASAEVKSIDVKGSLRGNEGAIGIGGGLSAAMSEYIDFCPAFNYYFCTPNAFTIDADFHYNIDIDDDWIVYPLFGGSFYYQGKPKDVDTTVTEEPKAVAAVGLNFGAGCQYQIIENIAVFTELKWQGMTKERGSLNFSVGFRLDV